MASSSTTSSQPSANGSNKPIENPRKPLGHIDANTHTGKIKKEVSYPKKGEAFRQLRDEFKDSIGHLREADIPYAVWTAGLLQTVFYDIANHPPGVVKGRINGHIRAVKSINREKIPDDCLSLVEKAEDALLNYQQALAKTT
ncbi:MAG: hypothetical protein Q8P54_03055 [bacterium]|nr:hypothetical protein [bacterium]